MKYAGTSAECGVRSAGTAGLCVSLRGWLGSFLSPLYLFPLLFLLLAGCTAEGSEKGGEPLPPVGTTPGHLAPMLAGVETGAGVADSFQLEEFRGQPAVVEFYRSAECGLCRERLRQLQEHRPEYAAAGARVVAVTLDSPEQTARAREALEIDFPIVSVDTATFARWDALDSTRTTPLPAAYLLNERGVIRFRHIGRNAGHRASDAELLTAVLQMQRGELDP